MIGYRVVDIVYLIRAFMIGSPEGPFGASFLGGIVIKPLLITLILYLIILSIFILLLKRISQNKIMIISIALIILIIYFLEFEIQNMVINQMVKSIDLKLK